MWTALLLAGQRHGVDPLAAAFGETAKALVAIGGEAMVSRVARTLLACAEINRIIILAQAPTALTAREDTAWLAVEPRIGFAASGDGIAASVAMLAGGVLAPWPVLVTTADHVLLTPALVTAFLAGAGSADVAVGVVDARTLRGAYPDSARTWLHFRGGSYSGANLFALGSARALPALAVWSGVERDRKRGWRLILKLGPLLLLGAVTRTLTLGGAMRRLGRRLGLEARAVVLADAEAAIDVDKPADHVLATRILAART